MHVKFADMGNYCSAFFLSTMTFKCFLIFWGGKIYKLWAWLFFWHLVPIYPSIIYKVVRESIANKVNSRKEKKILAINSVHCPYIPTDQCIDNKEFFQALLFPSSSSSQVGPSQVLDYDTQQLQPNTRQQKLI